MKKIGFAILSENKIINWGFGWFPPGFPNPHVDIEYFAGNAYNWSTKFIKGESKKNNQLKMLDPEKVQIKIYRVSSITDLRKELDQFELHNGFRGLDIKSMKVR